MPWSNIHIILTLILSFYYLIHFIPIILLLFATKTLKYMQSFTLTAVSLLFLQKTEKHSSFFTQAMKHFFMVDPGTLMVAVYKLAPGSIRAVSIFIELMATAGFVLGREEVTRTHFLISMGKVTLSYQINTLSPKGHYIPFFQYLQTYIRPPLPLSWI